MLRSATRGRRRGRISTRPSFSRMTTASRVGVRLVRKRRASSTELRSLPGRRTPSRISAPTTQAMSSTSEERSSSFDTTRRMMPWKRSSVDCCPPDACFFPPAMAPPERRAEFQQPAPARGFIEEGPAACHYDPQNQRDLRNGIVRPQAHQDRHPDRAPRRRRPRGRSASTSAWSGPASPARRPRWRRHGSGARSRWSTGCTRSAGRRSIR